MIGFLPDARRPVPQSRREACRLPPRKLLGLADACQCGCHISSGGRFQARSAAHAHRFGQPLVYGQSITDGCIGWDSTVQVLERLADAVRMRRRARLEAAA